MTDSDAVMSVVLLTRDGLEHRYVAAKLREVCPSMTIVLETPRRSGKWKRFSKLPFRVQASRISRKLLLKLLRDDRRRQGVLQSRLGPACEHSLVPFARAIVESWRREAAVEVVKRLAPDLILVYGTSVIPDAVLRQAKLLALNMHTGISPQYRGADCAFWPLANSEPEWLGATVHECTAELDAGRLFKTSQAACADIRCLHSAFAETVIVGAESYAEVLRRFVEGAFIPSENQDLASGKEYRAFMRGLGSEWRARRNVKRMIRAERSNRP